MNKLITALIFTIFTSLSLHAQTIRVLAGDQNIAQRKLSLAHKQKSQAITGMHHLARSKAFILPAKPENLRIVAKDRLADNGKPLSIALTIPEGIQQPLLVILPDEDAPTGIKTIVIEDSSKSFKLGSLLFINATGEDLVFNYEDKSEAIPKDLEPITITPGGETRNMGVSVTSVDETETAPLYTAIWKQRKDLRQLVFILPTENDARSRLEIKFIMENTEK